MKRIAAKRNYDLLKVADKPGAEYIADFLEEKGLATGSDPVIPPELRSMLQSGCMEECSRKWEEGWNNGYDSGFERFRQRAIQIIGGVDGLSAGLKSAISNEISSMVSEEKEQLLKGIRPPPAIPESPYKR